MDEMDSVVGDAITARNEGRYEDALIILQGLFDQVANTVPRPVGVHFMTMFEWSQLAEEYFPAQEALASARDDQVQRLLDGEEIFGDRDDARPHSRFNLIVEMNEILKDRQSTYELFVQLISFLRALAKREAFLALPAIVESGDFALAERYLDDPLEKLDELNRLACNLPLWPPSGKAPRLAAELSNFMKDVVLRLATSSSIKIVTKLSPSFSSAANSQAVLSSDRELAPVYVQFMAD